jgi:hypothetical protein
VWKSEKLFTTNTNDFIIAKEWVSHLKRNSLKKQLKELFNSIDAKFENIPSLEDIHYANNFT